MCAVSGLASLEKALAQSDIGAVDVVARKAKQKANSTAAAKPVVHRAAAARPTAAAHSRVTSRSNVPASAPTHSPAPVADAAVPSNLPPLGSPEAIGSNAPSGSAPALAPSQAPLNSFEPTSMVSGKFIHDITPPNADFSEALKFTPSFNSYNPNGPGNGEAAGITLRGFQDGQFNVTFDGIPFGDSNDFTHHTTSYFPAFMLGGAQIDRGPGYASTVGYATFGGTVGLLSRSFSDVMGADATGSYGSYNTWNSSGEVRTGVNKDTGTRALLDYTHNGSDGALQYGAFRSDGVLAKVEQPLGDSTTVTALASYSTDKFNTVAQISPLQTALFGKTYGGLNDNPGTQNFYGFNQTHTTTDFEYIGIKSKLDLLTVDNKIYTYAYSNNQTSTLGLQGNNPDGSNANGVSFGALNLPNDVPGFLQLNQYRSIGDILKVSKDIHAGIASGTLQAGVWAEEQNNNRNRLLMDWTLGQSYASLGANFGQSYQYFIHSKIDNIEPFVQYEWRPIEGLTITPGYKYVSVTRTQDAPINQGTGLPIDIAQNYNANLAFGSINYRLNGNSSVYAQAAQGFLAPNVNVLYVSSPAQNNLQPERTTNYQIGYNYKSNSWTVGLDAYYIDFSNMTTKVGTGVNQYYTNIGASIYKGLEAEVTYALGNGLAVFSSGSLMDGRVVETGLRIPYAPDYIVSGGLIYNNDQGLFGSVLTKVVGGQYTSGGQTTDNNFNHIAPYTTTDLTLGYKFKEAMGIKNSNVTVKAGVTNIFDSRAMVDSSIATLGNGALDTFNSTFAYLPGRMAYISMSAGF